MRVEVGSYAGMLIGEVFVDGQSVGRGVITGLDFAERWVDFVPRDAGGGLMHDGKGDWLIERRTGAVTFRWKHGAPRPHIRERLERMDLGALLAPELQQPPGGDDAQDTDRGSG